MDITGLVYVEKNSTPLSLMSHPLFTDIYKHYGFPSLSRVQWHAGIWHKAKYASTEIEVGVAEVVKALPTSAEWIQYFIKVGGIPAKDLTLYKHPHAHDVFHLFMKPLGSPKGGGGGGWGGWVEFVLNPWISPQSHIHHFPDNPFIMILIQLQERLRRNNHNAVQYTHKLFCL